MKIRRKTVLQALTYVAVVISMGLLLIPFFWMFVTSLMREREIYSNNYPNFHVLPQHPTFHNYISIFTEVQGGYQSFANSLAIALPTTAIVVVLAVLAAYALSRLRVKGKNTILFTMLFSSMVPTMGILIPYYLFTIKAGLYDTKLILILTYVAYIMPYSVWVMKGFFDTIPASLEEAAMVDGCTRLQALYKIILPLSLPGLAATGIFAFISSWNEFLIGLVLTETKSVPYPVWISLFVGVYKVAFAQLMAAAVVATIPVIIVALLFQKWILQGLIEGAVKG
ncbi:MAG: carbohydrate ABC transporter permease [Firmicutes bacterium]|nr:carbohydrate ABC transporter permease [Bacillota bacterium]